MEEFLQNICLLKDYRNNSLNKNIIVEGEEILEDIKEK